MDFRMGRNIPRGQRYTFTSPLAKAVLSYCLDGELQIGYMKVQAGSGFTSGMRGIIGLWQGYFISSVEHSTKAILCGYSDDYELSYDECDRILQLSVIQCSGGFLNREDSLEQEKYDKLYDEKLHIIQERILSRWREEKIQEQNKALQEEL